MMLIAMINVKNLLLLAILAIIAVSCARFLTRSGSKQESRVNSWNNVGVEQFQNLIADPDVQLLDVRTREEFDGGHIAGAILVDVNEDGFVEKAMAVLDKQRPVAVYCRSGRRSARAASQLAAQGMMVTNMEGGVIAWQDAGKSLVQ